MARPQESTVVENPRLEIRIWADMACPWCWIGHRRLEDALGRRPDLAARLTWEPFQLEPDLPPEGIAWARMLEERFEGPERARFLLEHVTELGDREGIRFDFDRMTRAPNTARAHALVLAAADGAGGAATGSRGAATGSRGAATRSRGAATGSGGAAMGSGDAATGSRGAAERGDPSPDWAVALRLFRAHFTEGADLSDLSVLRRIGREAGLAARAIDRALEGDELLRRVEASQREARSRGVQGVPFFLVDDRIALTGAQPPEVFVRALRTLRDPTLEAGDGDGDGDGAGGGASSDRFRDP